MANISDALGDGATRTVIDAKLSTDTGSATDISSATADAAKTANATIAGSYGNLYLGTDGSYLYEVDQTATAVTQLGEEGSLSESFTISLRETGGGDYQEWNPDADHHR